MEQRVGRHGWQAVLKKAYEEPGEWVLVPDVAQSTASRVRTGQVAAVRNFLTVVGGRIEVHQDAIKDGETTSNVGIRWIENEREES